MRKPLEEEKPNLKAFWAIVIIVGIVIMVLVKSFLLKAYVVRNDYMADCLKNGDFVLVSVIEKVKKPVSGEVVIFEYPAERSQYRFGRIVGISGQTIEIVNKNLYVNGELVEPPPTAKFVDPAVEDDLFSLRDNFGPYVVPQNAYFVLGDNRDRAIDSRNWGALPRKLILGKPFLVYFSWQPDPFAPDVNSVFDVPRSIFYNVTHLLNRIGLSRIGKKVNR